RQRRQRFRSCQCGRASAPTMPQAVQTGRGRKLTTVTSSPQLSASSVAAVVAVPAVQIVCAHVAERHRRGLSASLRAEREPHLRGISGKLNALKWAWAVGAVDLFRGARFAAQRLLGEMLDKRFDLLFMLGVVVFHACPNTRPPRLLSVE